MRALSVELVNTVVGTPDGALVTGLRRPLDGDDIRYIHACRRRGWGWQTIATSLRRCVIDVRVAAGDLEREARADNDDLRPGGRTPEAMRPVRPGTQMAAALLALAAGARTHNDLAAAIGTGRDRSYALVQVLGGRGLIGVDWSLTPMGRAEAKRLAALRDEAAADA